jgi:hypothetical protein
MTSDRNLDRLIEAYLEPGLDELPERSYIAVRASTARSRQGLVIGPWRAPDVMAFARPMLAVAVVALVAVIALGPGIAGSLAPAPTATPLPLPSANAYPGTPLEPGTYVAGHAGYAGRPQMAFTVPAGWYSGDGLVFNGPNDGYGATVVLEYRQLIDQVNADACHWAENVWRPMTTAQQLIDALANQPGMEVTAPRSVNLGGTPATLVEISIPAGFDTHVCDDLRLRFLNRNYGAEYPPAAGHTFWFYVIDTAHPSIVVAHAFADASAEDVAALQAVVDSIRFVDP